MTRKLRSLMVVCLMMMATAAMAMIQQDPGEGQPKRNNKRPNMEQFVKMQAQRIAQTLAFDDKTSQKFVDTFCKCRKEMATTRGGFHHKKSSEMTDAEADKVIKADFQQGKKLLEIREKYYKAYSKFLTPKQILRVYDLERQDMRRFAQRGPQNGGRFHPRKGGKPGQPKAQNCNPQQK